MLSYPLARAIDAVRINRVWTEDHPDGRRFYKVRRFGMGPVIAAGNGFLYLSNSRITMFPSLSQWRGWARHCHELVNGVKCGFHRRGLWMPELPGVRLKEHLQAGSLTETMMTHAGEALADAHRKVSEVFHGPWSHGDPHLDNLLVDETGARLIDFETLHDVRMDAVDRHVDDLLVLLLDLLGHADVEALGPYARSLVRGYDRRSVTDRLPNRLVCPSGFELVLWHTRTAFLPQEKLRERLALLRQALPKGPSQRPSSRSPS